MYKQHAEAEASKWVFKQTNYSIGLRLGFVNQEVRECSDIS
jgi:hypothetical protein